MNILLYFIKFITNFIHRHKMTLKDKLEFLRKRYEDNKFQSFTSEQQSHLVE
jgi:hypothetical protein